MSEDLFIPKLGQTVEEVVLINWLFEDGEMVEFGDPVLEVETDKAIFNVEANADGFLHIGPYKVGDSVPVLTVIATIGKQDEGFSLNASVSESSSTNDIKTVQSRDEAVEISPISPVRPEAAVDVDQKIFASPRARHLAKEKGINLSLVRPSGGGGVRVIEEDVLGYLHSKPKATPVAAAMAEELGQDLREVTGTGPKGVITRSNVASLVREKLGDAVKPVDDQDSSVSYATVEINTREPLRGIRKLIFDRMAQSDQTTARVTLMMEVDATALVGLREELKAQKTELWGFTPGYNDLIGSLVARLLPDFPYMNARVSADGRQVEYLGEVNLGIAVDTDRGLIVPVIKHADQMGLRDFGKELRQLVERAKEGRSRPADLDGGTFTITNLGNFDVDAFTPIINLPEVGILGLGRIADKVVTQAGEIQIRKMMTLSLVFDHRLIDGAPAARFLQEVKQGIEDGI